MPFLCSANYLHFLPLQLDHDQLPQLEEDHHDESEEWELDCGYGLLRPAPLPLGD